MGDLIKVSATVLPRFIDGDNLFVDVALNPYLTESKDSLSYYYEILNWTKYKEIFSQPINFKFSAFDKDWKPVPNPDIKKSLEGSWVDFADFFCEDIGTKEKNAVVAELLWSTMFTKETFVSQWNLDELPYNIVAKISSRELNNKVVEALDELIEDLVADNNSQDNLSLAVHLTNLKKSKDPALLILTDPIVSDVAANGRLRDMFSTLMRYINEYNNQLKDMYHDLSLHEQESRNVDNTAEFHKKFSGYSNHSFLLRKTGWIWRYAINISSIKKFICENVGYVGCADANIDSVKIFVSVDPNDKNNYRKPLYNLKSSGIVDPSFDSFHLSFLEEVKFLYPLTSLQFYKEDDSNLYKNVFVGTQTPKNEEAFLKLDSCTGYIKIKDVSEKHLYASIIDRKQLMDKLEQQYKTIKANAITNLSTIQEGVQNRDLSADIKNERAFSKNLAENGGYSEYTNNGITVALENYNRVIQTTITNTPAVPMQEIQTNLQGLEGTGMLFMHNVMAGLRIDTAAFNAISSDVDDSNFFFGSLCEKEEYFYIYNKNESFCIRFPDCGNEKKYEGYLGASGQVSNSGTLYIDQEITRWNNWSVVCMRLGDNRTYINKPPADGSSILNIAVMPPERSMVPQRFGWKYMFALRPTDICGEGPVPIDQQEQLLRDEIASKLTGKQKTDRELRCIVDTCWSDPILYQRVDAVSSPRIIFGTQIFESHHLKKQKHRKRKEESETILPIDQIPGWLSERWGEDLKTMVIRSHVENGELKINSKANSTVRFIGPPNANLDFVMQHGALDNLLLKQNGAIRESNDDDSLDKLRIELFSLANKKDEDEEMLQIVEDDDEINYLYDPLANGLKVELESEFHTSNQNWGMFIDDDDKLSSRGSVFDYIKECYWKQNGKLTNRQNRFFAIQLMGKKDDTDGRYYSFDAAKGTVEVLQGFEVNFQLSCVVKWQPTVSKIDLFYPGVAKARSTQMKVVHAVQKPCLLYNSYNSTTTFLERINRGTLSMKRFPNKAETMLNFNFEIFPVLTSESFHLHIQYIDLIGDNTALLGYRFEKIHKIIKSNLLPTDTSNELNVLFANIEHPFDDTKHRHANYRIEAVSKFKKYFDPKKFSGDDFFSVYGILRADFVSMDELNSINDYTGLDEYNQFVTKNKWQIIPNTKQPKKPVVEKIVPLTEWSDQTGTNGHTVERRCNKVRIYLEDWYSSGVNEKLAVFFLDQPNKFQYSSKNTIYIQSNNDKSLSTVISQFGLDPSSGEMNKLNIIDSEFLLTKTNKIPVIYNIPLSDLEFAKPDFETDLTYLDNLKVNAAIYEVQFINKDSINENFVQQYGEGNFEPALQGKYFIDIELKSDSVIDHYFPFLRLAVARYQENSIQFRRRSDNNVSFHYQFSPVVLTDFVQLLPYRKIEFHASTLTYYTGNATRSRENKCNTLLLFSEDESNKVYDRYGIDKSIYSIAISGSDNQKTKPTSENIRQCVLTSEKTDIPEFRGNFTHLNILEFENYDPADVHNISTYQYQPTDRYDDLRNDHKKRLIFSYSHKLATND
jgi:hypothetical protein